MTTTSTHRSRRMTATILGALALSYSALASAANDDGVLTAVVKFGDLNLSNPQGAAKLYTRIAAAANQVCAPFDIDSRGLGTNNLLATCIHTAIEDAVTKVGRPELFAIYNARNHQKLPMLMAATPVN